MGSARAKDTPREIWNLSTLAFTDPEAMDAEALREENRRLKELIVQLSRIVVRNATERK